MPAPRFEHKRFNLPLGAPPLAVLALVSLASLGGCGPDVNEFPPVCPASSILGDAADLTRYDGRGHDLTDLVLSARIVGFHGSCHTVGNGVLGATVPVVIDLTRGPAAQGREAEVRYFIAVTREQTILDKKVFATRVTFPANTDEVKLTGDPVELTIPTPDGLTGAAFKVIIGFQLTPEELELNRSQPHG